MTLKGTSSLQRTTYFHLYFHDSMLIFQKQPISLDSGMIEFAGVILRDSLKKAVLRRLKALKYKLFMQPVKESQSDVVTLPHRIGILFV